MHISVVICTYNPNPATLNQVIEALHEQTLSFDLWELIVVDNCSKQPVSSIIDLSWHPRAKFVIEKNPGLSYARVAGIQNSNGELIVFVDDDNLLKENYLEESFEFFQSNPNVGCFGGKALPVFETTPPDWFKDTGISLGCRDKGDNVIVSNYSSSHSKITSYPEYAPIGTGMVIQKDAFLVYLEEARSNSERLKLGRKGASLSSGEDNDIVLTIIKKGYEIAYFPELVVYHLISSNRYSEAYLQKMAFESNNTWVKVLEFHGINPWQKIPRWSYGIRKLKSYVVLKAWKSPLSKIRWKAACGALKGLTEI